MGELVGEVFGLVRVTVGAPGAIESIDHETEPGLLVFPDESVCVIENVCNPSLRPVSVNPLAWHAP
jgi:hypothetical protein